MVEKLTWKKLVWELVFFYAPWVFVGWIFGYLPWFTAGCYGIAARLASTQSNAFVCMVVG